MEEEDVAFVFNEEELLTVKITDAPADGWIIETLAKPCTVSHSVTIHHANKCVLYLIA